MIIREVAAFILVLAVGCLPIAAVYLTKDKKKGEKYGS